MIENRTVDYRWLVLVVVLAGIALVGTNMPPIGMDTPSFDVSSLGGNPEIPGIFLNPPDKEDRQNLTDYIIKSGYCEKENVGIIVDDTQDERFEDDGYIRNGGSYDFLFDVSELSNKVIPVSESIIVRNIEIVGKDGIDFEIENLALQNTSIPPITMNAMVLVKNATPIDNPYQLEIEVKQISSIKVGEEEMGPGEVRKVSTRDLAEKLKAGGHTLIEIKSVWIAYEKFS